MSGVSGSRNPDRSLRNISSQIGVNKFVILSFCLLVFISLSGAGQFTASRSDTINPGVPVNLSATYGLTAIGIASVPGQEDWVKGPFPIGFDFSFFGKKFNRFWVGANGWISFSPNPNSSGIRQAMFIPSAADYSPKNAIFGPFQDLNPMMDGSPYIFYQTIGEAPNRKLVVMWCECPMFLCESKKVTFQIVLNELGFTIENQIFSKPACPDNYGNKATLGLQDSTGYVGFSPHDSLNAASWSSDTLAFQYVPTSVDSFQIHRIPYQLQPIAPGDKISFRWYAGSEYLSDQQSIVVSPEVTTTYTAYCTLCSGQEFRTETTVVVKPGIPNAFSPNGDGLNDVFKITGIPPDNITLFNLQIFNRWGQVVFSTTDISQGWDGRLNGEYCPADYYTWIIFYVDNQKRRVSNKGGLMLVR
jgi:gliding motility-associated-like protein